MLSTALKRSAVLLSALLLLGACADGASDEVCGPGPAEAAFVAGEVWTYRGSDSDATFTVLCVEPLSDDVTVVHIATSNIPHLPFDEATLVRDRVSLVSSQVAVDESWLEGRQMWSDADGGIWTIPLAEAVDFVLGAVDQ